MWYEIYIPLETRRAQPIQPPTLPPAPTGINRSVLASALTPQPIVLRIARNTTRTANPAGKPLLTVADLSLMRL